MDPVLSANLSRRISTSLVAGGIELVSHMEEVVTDDTSAPSQRTSAIEINRYQREKESSFGLKEREKEFEICEVLVLFFLRIIVVY
jgi:hypothetical protein